MVKIKDGLSKSSKVFVSALLLLSIVGSILFADVFSGDNKLKLTGNMNQGMITAYAKDKTDEEKKNETEPDDELFISLSDITARAAEYYASYKSGAVDLDSVWQEGEPNSTIAPGLYGAFDENQNNGKSKFAGLILLFKKASNTEKVYDIGVSNTYYKMGYTLNRFGMDSYRESMMGGLGRQVLGAVMKALVAAAIAMGYVFDIMLDILKFTNPFSFFGEVGRFAGLGLSSDNAPKRLVTYFSTVYNSFSEFAINVVIPFTFTIFIVGFFVSKAYRGSAFHHFKKFIIRVIFIVVGIPLVGSIYNTALNNLASNFAVGGSYVENVVLSTFVDFKGLIEQSGKLPTSISGVRLGQEINEDSTRWSSLRTYALAFNEAAGHPVSDSGATFKNTNSVFTTDERDSFNATTSDGGANSNKSNVLKSKLYNLIESYEISETYAAADYEAKYYNPTADECKSLSLLTYQYSFYPKNSMKEKMVKLPSAISSDEKSVNIVGSAYEGVDGVAAPMSNMIPFTDNDATHFSTAATYNYLRSKFKDGTVTAYLMNTPNSQSAVQHYSVNLVGGSFLVSALLYINALVMLGGYCVLACGFVLKSTINAVFFGFDVMAEALFASLGLYKSIARCIAAMLCALCEVVVAMLFFSLCTELMYAVNYTVADIAASKISGQIGLVAAVFLATMAQFFFVKFCIKWKDNIVKSFQDVCREAVEQIIGVSTAGGFGAGNTAAQIAGSAVKGSMSKMAGSAMKTAAGVSALAHNAKANALERKNAEADKAGDAKDANQVDASGAENTDDKAQQGGADKASENNSNLSDKNSGSALNNPDGDNGDKADKDAANSVGKSVADGADSKSSTSTTSSEETSESSDDNGEQGDADKNENSENGNSNPVINGDAIVNGEAKGAGGNDKDGENTTGEKLHDNLERAEREQKAAAERAKAAEAVDKMNEADKLIKAGNKELLTGGMGGTNDYASMIAAGAGAAMGDIAGTYNYMTNGGRDGKVKDAVNGAHMELNEANQNLANARNAAAEASKNGVTEKRTYRDPKTGRLTTEEIDPLTGNTTETTTDENGNKITTTTAYGAPDKNGERHMIATSTTKENPETGEKESNAIAYDARAAAHGVMKPIGTSTAHVGADGRRVEEARDAKGNVTHMSETDEHGNTVKSFDRLADGGSREYKAQVDDNGNIVSSIDTTTAKDKTGSVTAKTFDEAGNETSSVTVAGANVADSIQTNDNGQPVVSADGHLVSADGTEITEASDIDTDGNVSVKNADGTGSEIIRDKNGRPVLTSETHKTADGNLETNSRGVVRNGSGSFIAMTNRKSTSDSNGNHLRTEDVTTDSKGNEISRSVTDASGNTVTSYPAQTGKYETVDENGNRHTEGEMSVASSESQSADGKTRTTSSVASYKTGEKAGQKTEKTTETKLNDDGTIASSTETTTNYDANGNITSQESTTVDSASGTETTSSLVRTQGADGKPVMAMSTKSTNMKTGETNISSSVSVPMVQAYDEKTGQALYNENGQPKLVPAVSADGKPARQPKTNTDGKLTNAPVVTSAVSDSAMVPAYDSEGNPVINDKGVQDKIPAVDNNGKPAMVPVFNAKTGQVEKTADGKVRMQPAVNDKGEFARMPAVNKNGNVVTKPAMTSAVSNTATVPAYDKNGQPVMNADGTQAMIPAVDNSGKPAMVPVFDAKTGKIEKTADGQIKMQPAVNETGEIAKQPVFNAQGKPVTDNNGVVMTSAVNNTATVPAFDNNGKPVMDGNGKQVRISAVNADGKPAMVPVFDAKTGQIQKNADGSIKMQSAVDKNGKSANIPQFTESGQQVRQPVMTPVSSDNMTVPAFDNNGKPVTNTDGKQVRIPAVNSDGRPAMVPVFNMQTGQVERTADGKVKMQPAVNNKGEFARMPVMNSKGEVQTSPVFEDVPVASMIGTANAVKQTSGTVRTGNGTYTTTTRGTSENTVQSFNDGTKVSINRDTATGQSVKKTERPDGTVVTEETKQVSVPGGGTVAQTIRTTDVKSDSNGNTIQTIERLNSAGNAEMTMQTVTKNDGSRTVSVRTVGENGQPKAASYQISKNNEITASDRASLADIGISFNETNGSVTENIAGVGERTSAVNGGRINIQTKTVTGGIRNMSRTVSSNASRPAGMTISESAVYTGDSGNIISSVETSYDKSGQVSGMKSSDITGHSVKFNAQQAVTRTSDGRAVTSAQAVYETVSASGESTVITGANASDVMTAAQGGKARNVQIQSRGIGQQSSYTEISGNGRAKVTGTTVTGDRFTGVTNANGSGDMTSETSAGNVVKQSFASGGHIRRAQSVNNITGAAENVTYNDAGQVTQRQTRNASNVETVYNASYNTQGNMTGGSVTVTDKFRGTQVTTGVNQHGVVTRSVKDAIHNVNTVQTRDASGVETTRTVDMNTGNTMQSVNNTRNGVSSVSYTSANSVINRQFSVVRDAGGNTTTRRSTLINSYTSRGRMSDRAMMPDVSGQFRQNPVNINGVINQRGNIPSNILDRHTSANVTANIAGMTAGTVIRGANNAINIQGMSAASQVASYVSASAPVSSANTQSVFRGGMQSGGNIMNPAGSHNVVNNYYMGSKGGLSTAGTQTGSGLSSVSDRFTAQTMRQGMTQNRASESRRLRVPEAVAHAVSSGVSSANTKINDFSQSMQSRTDALGTVSRGVKYASIPAQKARETASFAAGMATSAIPIGRSSLRHHQKDFARKGREARLNGTLDYDYANPEYARRTGVARPYVQYSDSSQYRTAQFGNTDNIMNQNVSSGKGLTEEDIRRMIYEQSAVMHHDDKLHLSDNEH